MYHLHLGGQQILHKLTIPVILSVAILISGVFALMPVEKASTVHATILASVGVFDILSLEKTLPMDEGGPGQGDDRTWTLTAVTDVIVRGVYHDNTPTLDEPLCTFADHHAGLDTSVHCDNSDYRIVDMEIAGSELQTTFLNNENANRNVNFPRQFDTNDHLQLTEYPQISNFPLKADETIVMVFDTTETANDVRINVIFAVTGEATLE